MKRMRCFICGELRDSTEFSHKAHVFPAALTGNADSEPILERGTECDACNSRYGRLEQKVMNTDLIRFVRAAAGYRDRRGRPVAYVNNGVVISAERLSNKMMRFFPGKKGGSIREQTGEIQISVCIGRSDLFLYNKFLALLCLRTVKKTNKNLPRNVIALLRNAAGQKKDVITIPYIVSMSKGIVERSVCEKDINMGFACCDDFNLELYRTSFYMPTTNTDSFVGGSVNAMRKIPRESPFDRPSLCITNECVYMTRDNKPPVKFSRHCSFNKPVALTPARQSP